MNSLFTTSIWNIKDRAFISFPVFLISLTIGVFFVYVLEPPRKTVYVYPTPDNLNTIQYKDKADQCFMFTADRVPCSKQSVPTQYTIQQ